MKRHLISRVCVFLASLFPVFTDFAQGQDTDPKSAAAGEKVVGMDIANVSGTLEAVAGDKIKIKSDDGKEYFAVVGAQTKVEYTGTAETAFLGPGLFVRFTAAFDPKTGIPANMISEIEIFRPARQRRMSMEQKQDQTPGVYPVVEEARGDKKSKAKIAAPPPGSQNFRIVGQVRAVMADKMQVAAGMRPFMIQLDPAATVTVSSGDAMFCKQGDQVTVNGLANPSQESWIQAESIEIAGAEPLKLPEANTNRRSRGSRDKTGGEDASKPSNSKDASSPKKKK